MEHKLVVKTAIALAILASCGSTSKLALTSGCNLQYDVISSQKSVRVDVSLLQTQTNWDFDYTVQQENLSGKITISKQANLNSNELYHSFNGVNKSLTTSTSLRISDSSYLKLKSGEAVDLSYRIGFVKNTYAYKVVENQKIKYLINGKLKMLEVLYITDTSDKGLALWVWDNANTPLILRQKLGYEMVLKEISIP
ncbi:MAG: hypothetical protein ACI8SE_001647 [Bacteroidia bacterium]|jgi:hypothetical protein